MNRTTQILIAVFIAIAAFFGGMQYQSSKTKNAASGVAGGQFAGGRAGGRTGRNTPVVGEVLSIDSGSMTVKLTDGSSKVIVIGTSTAINKAAKATVSDIQTGTRVAVFGTTNSDGSVTAQNVQLNPQLGLRGGGVRPSGMPGQTAQPGQ